MYLILLCLATVSALPSGAPGSTCKSMLPKHRDNQQQTSPTPFKIDVELNDTTSVYTIIIQDPNVALFKGFMLQARGPSDELVGIFRPVSSSVRTFNCSHPGDTVTHSNSNQRVNVKVSWNPNGYKGSVVFKATIVQNFTTFWTDIKSSEIQITPPSPLPTTIETTESTTETTESTIETTESTESPNTENDAFYDGCNVVKACFGAPVDCVKTKNCQAVVAVTVYDENYEFEMKAAPAAAWVGVGLSRDAKMGDDSVIECVKEGSKVKSYISSTAIQPTPDVTRDSNQNNIQLLQGSVTDGWMYCRVLRETRTTINGVVYDLAAEKFHLLIASGDSVHPNKVGFHTEQYLASGERKFLADVSAIKAASKLLLRLHGAFMVAAWLGTASIGIVLARYYKQVWPGKQVCGKDIWFAWHRILMILTWCLTMVGFILVWVELKAWSAADSPHAILGTITTILCFIQPIGAILRPHPGTKLRPLFNWLHWLAGNTAQIVGIVAIFFAVTLNKAELPGLMYWILGVCVVFHAIMHIIFSVMSRAADKSTKQGKTTEVPFSTSRQCLLAMYIFVNILIVTALVIITALAPI